MTDTLFKPPMPELFVAHDLQHANVRDARSVGDSAQTDPSCVSGLQSFHPLGDRLVPLYAGALDARERFHLREKRVGAVQKFVRLVDPARVLQDESLIDQGVGDDERIVGVAAGDEGCRAVVEVMRCSGHVGKDSYQ